MKLSENAAWGLKLGGFTFPFEVQLTIEGGSEIVMKTPVASEMGDQFPIRRGTVKEFVGLKDYGIRARGVLSNEMDSDDTIPLDDDGPDEYPETMVADLRIELERRDSVPIEHPLLEALGIRQVVIMRFSFLPSIGRPGEQEFEIDMVSDEDPEAVFIDL